MSQAIIAREWEALTVELRVRFRARVSPGDRLHVRGWIVEKKGRKILTEATLKTHGDVERAHAWATFLIPPKRTGQFSGTAIPVKIRRAVAPIRKSTRRMIEVNK